MRRNVLEMLILPILLTLAAPAHGETPYVFKHDQFSDSIQAASQELSGIALGTQPGFVKGEAFGAVFKPANMYPVKIQGIDVVVAAMPNDIGNSKAHATIEIYFFDGDGPDPGGPPVFTLSTYDVYNEQIMDLGAPLQGNTAMSFEFDWDDFEGHPPLLTSGNFLVAVRFSEDAADLQSQWDNWQCQQLSDLGMCGCQRIGTLHDQVSTPQANVLHIIYPPGTCGGTANKWVWFGDVGVTGDVILRARASVADAPCVPSCLDKECGADGCDGSCGVCTGAGESCVAGMCEACEPACGVNECGGDGCGGSCGECGEGSDCVQGVCEGPCVPVCDGKACGADQCGGSCGDCAADKTCNASGQCVGEGVCDPVANCTGKTCGTDGCGGFCGVCSEGENCVMGTCTTSDVGDAEFTIVSITPEVFCNDESAALTISGTNFVDDLQVELIGIDGQGQKILVASKLASNTLRVTVPVDMSAGMYDLRLVGPDDTSVYVPSALKVISCGDTSGCGVAATPDRSTGLGLLLLLAGLALAWRRARA